MPGQEELQERAERIFREAFPHGFENREARVDVTPTTGTMFLFVQTSEQDPLCLLRSNGNPLGTPLFAAALVDPVTGRPARRYMLPFKCWSHPERLSAALKDDPERPRKLPDWSRIRLAKGIPEGVEEFRYGRSGRLAILLDRPWALLAVQVFPGGLVPSDRVVSPERLAHMAWVLLARSGVDSRPYSCHMLRRGHVFHVERAAEAGANTGAEGLEALEVHLLKSAEEDRKILDAMMSPQVPEVLFGGLCG
jgi:hypothetical protein